MKEIRIFDGAFTGPSASLSGECIGEMPGTIQWTRDGGMTNPSVFTDGHLGDVETFKQQHAGRNIAWLLEPSELRPENYKTAIGLESVFDLIMTHERAYALRKGWAWYPFGGSWIKPEDWGMAEKTKLVSIIGTDKNSTQGHRLRQMAAELVPPEDRFGRGYREIDSKLEALAPYKFSIVIESSRASGYFTEKLIDCLSVGTIPLYWGDPLIGQIFDQTGILVLDSLMELRMRLAKLEKLYQYELMKSAAERNLETAKLFRACEDNLPLWV